MKNEDWEIFWDNHRYRIFGAFPLALLTGVVAFLFGSVLESFTGRSLPLPLTAFAGICATTGYTILDPRINPRSKVWLTKKLISPPVPLFSPSQEFKWENQQHVITIKDTDGTCKITKKMTIKNVGDSPKIVSHPNNFQFSCGEIKDVYEYRGDDHPVKCSRSNGDMIKPEYLIREDAHVEFLTEFQTPVDASETYEIELDRVEGAFPLADQRDSWRIRFYSECENLDVSVIWNYDVRITQARMENMLTGEQVPNVRVNDDTNQIKVEAEKLSAGYYKVVWEKEKVSP